LRLQYCPLGPIFSFQSKGTIGKVEVEISTLPNYCYYDLFDSIRQGHIDQQRHPGAQKSQSGSKKHYINGLRSTGEKFIAD
jgi:hypothetical protein